jgi:hypothetical protein
MTGAVAAMSLNSIGTLSEDQLVAKLGVSRGCPERHPTPK